MGLKIHCVSEQQCLLESIQIWVFVMMWLVFQPPKTTKKYEICPNTQQTSTFYSWNTLNFRAIWVKVIRHKKNRWNPKIQKNSRLKPKFAVWCSGAPLLLPGEMNILQIECKIYFNTFLLRKSHGRGIKWLKTMSEVHVGWLLGIPCYHRWFLELTGNIWWLSTIFCVFFTTLSLNNASFCVNLCYL